MQVALVGDQGHQRAVALEQHAEVVVPEKHGQLLRAHCLRRPGALLPAFSIKSNARHSFTHTGTQDTP